MIPQGGCYVNSRKVVRRLGVKPQKRKESDRRAMKVASRSKLKVIENRPVAREPQSPCWKVSGCRGKGRPFWDGTGITPPKGEKELQQENKAKQDRRMVGQNKTRGRNKLLEFRK